MVIILNSFYNLMQEKRVPMKNMQCALIMLMIRFVIIDLQACCLPWWIDQDIQNQVIEPLRIRNHELPARCVQEQDYVNSLLWMGVVDNSFSLVDSALIRGAHVNFAKKYGSNMTVLMRAAFGGYTDIVDRLLEEKNIVVNSQSNDGNTALICAVMEGHVPVVQRLLQASDINVNIVNTYGKSAILYSQFVPITLALIQVGADINAYDKEIQSTLLMHATKMKDLSHIRVILRSGADINMKDHRGDTALLMAARSNSLDIVRMMLVHDVSQATIADALLWKKNLSQAQIEKYDLYEKLYSQNDDAHTKIIDILQAALDSKEDYILK